MRRSIALAIAGSSLLVPSVADAEIQTTTFDKAGRHTYTVPAGVTSVQLQLVGGRGGNAPSGAAGGLGARADAPLAVTPGEVLTVYVGGNAAGAAGGFNGGGAGGRPTSGGPASGAGGGGATDVRRGTARVAVAGGGGGAAVGWDSIVGEAYGAKGGAAGTSGQPAAYGGGAGTSSKPGVGGTAEDVGTNGKPGSGSIGGAGAGMSWPDALGGGESRSAGGGGGGGRFGGGGGAVFYGTLGGGGGGSSLAPGGTVAADKTGKPSATVVADVPAPPAPQPDADPSPSPSSAPAAPSSGSGMASVQSQGGPPAPAADTVAPVLRRIGLSTARFRVTARPAGAPKAIKRGSELFADLSEAATLRLSVVRQLPGRRSGRRCTAPSRATRAEPRCTRTRAVGTADLPAPAGLHAVALPTSYLGGRLTRGRFRLAVVAVDAAGNRSAPATTSFTVVR